jgi:hypothetical protein
MPPTIKKVKKWLVVTAHCGDYLPQLDAAIGAMGMDLVEGGIDAYYKAEFSDSKVASKVVTVKGKTRNSLNPAWNFELWLPVSTPTATNRVKHSIYDYDLLGDHDLAGCFYTNFKDVDKAKNKKIGPLWFNLYGAPLVSLSTASQALAGASSLANALTGGVNWTQK